MLRRRRLHHQFRDALNALEPVSSGLFTGKRGSGGGKGHEPHIRSHREISREMAYMAAQMRVSVPVEKLFYDLGAEAR